MSAVSQGENVPRLFAVIPAAGNSRRMGRDKLLLPFAGSTVIAHLLAVLRQPEIVQTVVVIRPGDQALAEAVAAEQAHPLQPATAPPEMRQSVEAALQYLRETFQPEAEDGWLLIPADHPLIDVEVLRQLIAAWQARRSAVLVPVHEGKRGHPTLFRWDLAAEVTQLPPDVGLNVLVRRAGLDVRELEVESPSVLLDLDTPADYARLLAGEAADRGNRTGSRTPESPDSPAAPG